MEGLVYETPTLLAKLGTGGGEGLAESFGEFSGDVSGVRLAALAARVAAAFEASAAATASSRSRFVSAACSRLLCAFACKSALALSTHGLDDRIILLGAAGHDGQASEGWGSKARQKLRLTLS